MWLWNIQNQRLALFSMMNTREASFMLKMARLHLLWMPTSLPKKDNKMHKDNGKWEREEWIELSNCRVEIHEIIMNGMRWGLHSVSSLNHNCIHSIHHLPKRWYNIFVITCIRQTTNDSRQRRHWRHSNSFFSSKRLLNDRKICFRHSLIVFHTITSQSSILRLLCSTIIHFYDPSHSPRMSFTCFVGGFIFWTL